MNLIFNKNFAINHRHVGWLGTGVYFFENNKYLAKDYAQNRHPGKKTSVIEVTIKFKDNEIFDTTIDRNAYIFHTYRDELKNKIKKTGDINVIVKNGQDFDGKVYDLIAKRENYKLIRAKTFTPMTFDRAFRLKPSRVPNGIELCLKEVRCIQTMSEVES